ncbi:MAG: hypothetical protein ACKODY_07070, partial [Actinomycetota bacterium]
MREITPPIELVLADGSARARFDTTWVDVPEPVLVELARICATDHDDEQTSLASRDWWPLSMKWALDGMVP